MNDAVEVDPLGTFDKITGACLPVIADTGWSVRTVRERNASRSGM
jgi:hypothetical protein